MSKIKVVQITTNGDLLDNKGRIWILHIDEEHVKGINSASSYFKETRRYWKMLDTLPDEPDENES